MGSRSPIQNSRRAPFPRGMREVGKWGGGRISRSPDSVRTELGERKIEREKGRDLKKQNDTLTKQERQQGTKKHRSESGLVISETRALHRPKRGGCSLFPSFFSPFRVSPRSRCASEPRNSFDGISDNPKLASLVTLLCRETRSGR